MLVGAFVGCVYGINGLKGSYRWIFNGERLKEMLLFSAPLVPSGIAVFVSHYIDRLMINRFLSLGDLGVYGIGFRLSSIVGLVMVGFQSALTPLIYTNYHLSDTPKQIEAIFRAFLFFAFMMFFCLLPASTHPAKTPRMPRRTWFARISQVLAKSKNPHYYIASLCVSAHAGASGQPGLCGAVGASLQPGGLRACSCPLARPVMLPAFYTQILTLAAGHGA